MSSFKLHLDFYVAISKSFLKSQTSENSLSVYSNTDFLFHFLFFLSNSWGPTEIWEGSPLGLLPSCHPEKFLPFSVLSPQDTNAFVWGINCLEPSKEKVLRCFCLFGVQ